MESKSAADVLTKAAEIVDRGWCQHWYAKDAAGNAIGMTPSGALKVEAVSFCAVGAIIRADGGDDFSGYHPYVGYLERAIGRAPISEWNDARGRTKGEVIAALHQAAAIALAEAK